MNLNFYISQRIGTYKTGKGKLSKTSNFIATVSVALSIFIMILSLAISNGFRKEIREKAVGYSGDMTITAPGVTINNDQYPLHQLPYIQEIKDCDFIKSINPVRYTYGILKTPDQIQGIVLKGVDNNYNWDFLKSCLSAGKLPDYSDTSKLSNDILISARMSQMLQYKVGDKVTAYFINDEVKVRRFNITGLYNAQLEDLDKLIVIADTKQVARLNGWDNVEVSGYEVFLKESAGDNFEQQQEVLQNIIDKHSTNDKGQDIDVDDAWITTVKDSFTLLFDWLGLLDTNVIIIIVLMIAVSGFNMISGILIILFERISMIGTLKALGMRTRNIAMIFLYQASSIVLKGLLYGNILSAIFCFIQWKYRVFALNPENYFVDGVPISISPMIFLIADLIAFTAIMIILVIPCHFISRISPAKTLKFD